jgi:hypothetical protein
MGGLKVFSDAHQRLPEESLPHCPLTHDQRLRHLSTDGTPDSLRKLFDSPKRCLGVLRFLEETRVCTKPWTAWEPGYSSWYHS